MKCLLKYAVCSLAVAALLVAPLRQAQAQGNAAKPAIVVSLAQIDEQVADVAYLFKAAGFETIPLGDFPLDAEAAIKSTVMQFTQGIDQSKPIGGYVSLEGGQPSFAIFIPVSDLGKFLDRMKQMRRIEDPEDAGDGALKITTLDGQEVFVKEQGGWAFVSNALENLATLPQDPSKLLNGLHQKYNLAIQVNAGNIPDALKQQAITALRDGYMASLDALPPDQDPETQEMMKKLSQNSIKQMTQLIEESDQLMFGWGVDSMASSTFIDISFTARDGTTLAKRMAMLQDTKSDFAGFQLPDAAVTLNFVNSMSMEDIEVMTTMLKTMRKTAMKELDNDNDLNDGQRAAAKEVLGTLLDVAQKTIDGGKVDAGAALVLAPQSFTCVGGGLVADGAALEGVLKKFASLVKDDPGFPGKVQLDAATHGDIRFHAAKFPVPADEDVPQRIFGEELDVVVGFGPKSVYAAFGKESLSTLKKAIDKSAADADKVVAPSQATIALGPIMKFAASVTDDPTVAKLDEVLSQTGGKDKILMNTKAIPRGAITHLEIQSGIIKAIGEGVKFALGGLGGGGGDF